MRAHAPQFRLLHLTTPAVAALVFGFLFSACSRSDSPADAASSFPSGSIAAKILRLGNGTEPQELDPHVVSGVSEHRIISALLEGLVTEPPSGEGVAPGVAERWDTSPDGLTWTFHLRPDARWSNGDAVTARDFLNAFQRILTPSLAAEYAYKLHHVVGAEAFHRGEFTDFAQTGFSAPDERTLVLRLKHPVPYLLDSLKHYAWFPIHLPTLATHGPVDRRGNRWTRPGNYVGNGAFVLKEWRPDQFISVERSPTYWNAAANRLDGLVFHAITDENTEERMFRSGQLDVTYTLPADKIDAHRSSQPDALRITPYYGTYFYRLNTTRPPLDDARVRRALALAIDREAIVATILRAGQEPAYNFTPSGFGFTPDQSLSSDVAEARRLLAEAGYPEGRGLRRLEILYNTMDAHRRVAEAIQEMWRTRLGIDVSLRNEEWQVYLDSQRKLDYDIARAGWIGDYPHPHTFLDLLVSGGGNNDTGYSNPEYDRRLASVLAESDESARLAAYRELENTLVRDVPVIPLYFYKRVYLVSPRVKNWEPRLLDHRAWQFIDLAD